MNKIILLGRLVKDPEVRVTPTDRTVCTFTLAVDRPFTAKNGQREADFINIVTWNKTAELCGNSLTKGQRALVEGRLQIRKYQDKQGQNRTVSEVVADRVEFIERKADVQKQPTSMAQMGTDVTKDMPFDDIEDVPF